MNELNTDLDWKKEESVWGAFRGLAIFLVIAVIGGIISHATPLGQYMTIDKITQLSSRLGKWGPIVIGLAGILTPLLFLPRWPIAFLSGLLYGITWGTLLAVCASTLGAWLHYYLSKTLLAPMTDRIRRKYDLRRFMVSKDKEFMMVFFLRAFPLSNFVLTNLIAGAFKMDAMKYIIASFFGMIPSTMMYAAWGKLMKKPSGHYYLLAVGILILFALATAAAHRLIHSWQNNNRSKV